MKLKRFSLIIAAVMAFASLALGAGQVLFNADGTLTIKSGQGQTTIAKPLNLTWQNDGTLMVVPTSGAPTIISPSGLSAATQPATQPTTIASTQPVTDPVGPTTQVSPAGPMILGINVEQPSDYSYPIFADCMNQSRQFGYYGHPWDALPASAIGPDGWPTGDFGVVVITNGAPGVYQFECSGNPTISFNGDQPARSFTYDPFANATIGTVTIDHLGQTFTMSFKQGSQRVTRVHVMRPGYTLASTDYFTADFINKLKGYNTLRFMDWQWTNGNLNPSWSQRLGYRLSYETMIQLCNTTNTGGWFCVPIAADDDYVKHMADLLRDTMGHHDIYIEYSNEIWNPAFSQQGWTKQQSDAAFAANPTDPQLWFGFQSSADAAKWPWSIEQNWVARRTVQVSQIFHQEFAGDPRLHFVLAGQLANFATTDSALKWTKQFVGDPKKVFEAIAAAPYIQLDDSTNNLDTLTVDQVIAGEFDYFVGMQKDFAAWAGLKSTWGIPLISYEGAIDTVGDHSSAAKLAAVNDPRTRDLLLMLLTKAEQSGFTQFNYFHLTGLMSKYDTDALIDVEHPDLVTPAKQAIQDFQAGKRMATPPASPWQ